MRAGLQTRKMENGKLRNEVSGKFLDFPFSILLVFIISVSIIIFAPSMSSSLLLARSVAQPKLVTAKPSVYPVGGKIDPDAFVIDRDLQAVWLMSLIRPESRAVILVIFGGAAHEIPAGEPFRGPLWCEDSFDDLAVQRALVHSFAGKPVQFIAVAVPPVYNPSRYGFPDDAFLGEPLDSESFREATRMFIRDTEKERESGLLPFETIYYDPKFRIAQNREERQPGPEYGPAYEWEGKLRWPADSRKYATPILWLLGPDGTILRPPLFGNDYDSKPPQILYGFEDARQAIEEVLSQ